MPCRPGALLTSNSSPVLREDVEWNKAAFDLFLNMGAKDWTVAVTDRAVPVPQSLWSPRRREARATWRTRWVRARRVVEAGGWGRHRFPEIF
jgi:hypothetical protein